MIGFLIRKVISNWRSLMLEYHYYKADRDVGEPNRVA